MFTFNYNYDTINYDYYDNGGMLPHDDEGFADLEGLNDWGNFDSDDIVEEPVRDLDGIVDYVSDILSDE